MKHVCVGKILLLYSTLFIAMSSSVLLVYYAAYQVYYLFREYGQW